MVNFDIKFHGKEREKKKLIRINYAVSGLHTTTYHIVNIILHAIICAVLYKIIINLSIIFYGKYPSRIAFRVSLLFAVHPIHSEAPLCATFDIFASNISPIRFFIVFRKRMDDYGSNNKIDRSTQRYCECIHRASIIFGHFYVITFLPASNIFVTVGFVIAERVLYLPSVAFCIIAVSIYERIEEVMTRNKTENILKSVTTIVFVILLAKSYKV
ncbi:hypothetical protein LOAG_08742 [Loa loa]|uniref:Uncharacterized protein n=1 Tax=Loa loa TaxID=7209 RepID=A0A1S0TSX8_LOALO|nr:hypothetical protein LOAG_08742 [Loa loa]EFO19749.1 hypothetical protein LOAG_08742 [Loa loa]